MITLHFPSGKKVLIPGATKFVTDDGLMVEFSTIEAVSSSRQLRLTKKEKWEALCKWLPAVFKATKGDSNEILSQARRDGFYAAGGGDCQMLWQVMKHLGLEAGR